SQRCRGRVVRRAGGSRAYSRSGRGWSWRGRGRSVGVTAVVGPRRRTAQRPRQGDGGSGGFWLFWSAAIPSPLCLSVCRGGSQRETNETERRRIAALQNRQDRSGEELPDRLAVVDLQPLPPLYLH